MKSKIKSKVIAAVMSLAMAFTMMPITGGQTAHADDTALNSMIMGADVLSTGSNTSEAQAVFVAGVEWRVIGYGESTDEKPQVASSADTMTLISDKEIGPGTVFRNDSDTEGANYYGKNADDLESELKQEVDMIAKFFNYGEREAIISRTLESGDYIGENTDCIGGDPVEDALLWPLSTKEARMMNKNLRTMYPDNPDWPAAFWWLRSPGMDNSKAAYIHYNGAVRASGVLVRNQYVSVRPAFNIGLDSVIFTSSTSGKADYDPFDQSLQPVGVNMERKWKLTLKDDRFKEFEINVCEAEYNSETGEVTVPYKNASCGSNRYISAIVTDYEGKIIREYGKINKLDADQNSDEVYTATLNIKDKMNEGDRLFVFNEIINAKDESDYASEPVEIPIPATGHDFGKWRVTKPATTTAKGEETRVCKYDSSHKETRAIAKLAKKANPLKFKGKTATVKYSKLKKKAQTLAVSKVITFTKKGQGKMTYTKVSGNKKIAINKTTGKVTVKKGMKKGTYSVKVKVRAAGNVNYKASAWKTVTFKVKVK